MVMLKLKKSNLSKNTRVLIINPYPIGANCPIGIMMKSLFKAFPASEVLQYYTHPCDIEKDSTFRSERIDFVNPLYTYLKNSILSICHSMTRKKFTKGKGKDVRLRSIGARSSQIKSWIDYLLPVKLPKDQLKQIEEFNPSVIYTQVYSYPMLKFVTKVSKKLSCPIVVHTLDDWMTTQYKKGIISKLTYLAFMRHFKFVLNNGMTHMVASPKMETFMKAQYGGNYTFVMNCCSFPDYIRKTRLRKVKIVYTGGLMLERYQALNDIAKCIRALNFQEQRFELHIYAPNSEINEYREEMDEGIFFHENVNHNEVYSLLTESDILVHVESFNPNVINFTKYSLSTKIPEYLAAGRPIIYFGPGYIGVGEFLKQNKLAKCVENVTSFKKELLLLCENEQYYELLSIEPYEKGKLFFKEERMQKRLKSCLTWWLK